MVIQVVTLFPEMFSGVFDMSMVKRARLTGRLDLRVIPLRAFGVGIHRQTDDYPFGGAVGMLLRCDVVVPAVEWCMMHEKTPARVILTSPQGRSFTQRLALHLSRQDHLIIVAGHYEGIDERVRLLLQADEVSIGDYVLTGGELPAMVMVDAVSRLLPGVLGSDDSAKDDSFSRADGWLEGPQYTRPVQYRNLSVPDVLRQGNHRAIAEFREEMARQRTRARRPDLVSD
ncbi:MAG: tRNA (guanosine(37)-N1)-methyltransferase TrmD [Sulfobacillus acidophilus]|uniref:tRNA (guanine-N(1)-)-methyltransferase n=1 Tax=Sulfobacillus acidophilus TaxID=53633 RepID=A0A2T2WHZ9_9FIRM|nr:MAG: tRNA (guanosine(37)-N1)-methyltransferase TrmD [Sulfobacillus acidophilus]